MPKNVRDLCKLIVAKGFKKVAQSAKNRQIWSHWSWYQKMQERDSRWKNLPSLNLIAEQRDQIGQIL